jgi:hypothetical protein
MLDGSWGCEMDPRVAGTGNRGVGVALAPISAWAINNKQYQMHMSITMKATSCS